MKLRELMKPGGTGVIATASGRGGVNTAIYSSPHIIDDETVAWGMTEGRTFTNVKENPQASYLYRNPGGGYSGVRLTLTLKRIEDSGKLLEGIKAHTSEIVNPTAGDAVKYVGYFTVMEILSLI